MVEVIVKELFLFFVLFLNRFWYDIFFVFSKVLFFQFIKFFVFEEFYIDEFNYFCVDVVYGDVMRLCFLGVFYWFFQFQEFYVYFIFEYCIDFELVNFQS